MSCSVAMAQQQSDILSVSASANAENAALAFDRNVKTMWTIPSQALKAEQWLMFTIQQPGDVCELDLQMQGINKNELKEVLDIFVTYDPMNLGTPVNYRIEGSDKQMKVKFTPKYGAHVKLNFKSGKLDKPFSLKEISVLVAEKVLTDTLLNTLAGSIDPMSGSIDRGHGDTAIAQVYQDIRLVEELSAIDNVMLIASAGLSSAEARKRLEELLPSDAIDVPVGALSGGQRRRVELVRAFAASSHLVLLDEPFTGLDAQARELAQTHILAHMEDRAVLISAHDATSLDLPLDAIISVGTACHAGSQTARP